MSTDNKARPGEKEDGSGATRQSQQTRDPKDNATRTAKPGVSGRPAAAATDEAMAKEALEGLKRVRAQARMDKMAISKPAPAPVRPAVIVAKPPPPRPSWVVPLATLAVALGLVMCACTGVIAYLMTNQPSNANLAANAEIRNLRETVAQLRRQVSGVSENLDGLRTAVDLSSKATTDRFGRFAENLDRIERVSSASTAKLDKLAQAQPPVTATAQLQPQAQSQPSFQAQPQATPMVASAGPAADITGSVSSSERAASPRKVMIKGWSVREAYEGVAILQGPGGTIEVVLGQQVPALGRIEEIKNENGRLVVLSSAGVILSTRKGQP
jgi:hypothetical protein